MHAFFKCQILRSSQCYFRGDQTLHHRVICQVQIHDHVICNTAFFKGTAEKFGHVVFDTHGSKYDGKFFIAVTAKGSLLYDLGSKLIVGKAVS